MDCRFAWLVTGKTVGGLDLYPQENRLDREEALRLYTRGSAWFSKEEDQKGAIQVGMFADVATLNCDYLGVEDGAIKSIESVLTLVGGAVVYAAEEFASLAPPALPASPSWSPGNTYGGYQSVPVPHAHESCVVL